MATIKKTVIGRRRRRYEPIRRRPLAEIFSNTQPRPNILWTLINIVSYGEGGGIKADCRKRYRVTKKTTAKTNCLTCIFEADNSLSDAGMKGVFPKQNSSNVSSPCSQMQEGGADAARIEGGDLHRQGLGRGNESSGKEHRHEHETEGAIETSWLEITKSRSD